MPSPRRSTRSRRTNPAYWRRIGDRHVRPLIPFSPIETASPRLGSRATPLLEKERHFMSDTLVPDVPNPSRVHRPCLGTGLAADDHPMYAIQRQLPDRTDKWFN